MDHQEALTGFLAERDEPCPRCGYNLRAITGLQCPECGSGLRLRVGLADPKVAAYVLTIGIAATGFGGALLFTLLALFHAGLDWWLGDGMVSGALLVALLITTAPVLVVGLLARRVILRRAPLLQWAGALLTAFYVLVMFVAIVTTFDG